jgi:hypothetical protein
LGERKGVGNTHHVLGNKPGHLEKSYKLRSTIPFALAMDVFFRKVSAGVVFPIDRPMLKTPGVSVRSNCPVSSRRSILKRED